MTCVRAASAGMCNRQVSTVVDRSDKNLVHKTKTMTYSTDKDGIIEGITKYIIVAPRDLAYHMSFLGPSPISVPVLSFMALTPQNANLDPAPLPWPAFRYMLS